MDKKLTDNVRLACETVAARSENVRIKTENIPAYAAALPLEMAVDPEHVPTDHYLGQGADTATFFLTLDTINFGSGWFPHLKKRPGKSGYFTVASSLTDRFQSHGPMTASQLSDLTTKDCADIFGQDVANPHATELMGLFAKALNDLGRFLEEHFGGDFPKLIEAAESSAERLAWLLSKMPFFNDVEQYGEFAVPFYKRAQLAAADLSVAFSGKGLGCFTDLDRLTIFADNLVPHVLRMDGILDYTPPLAHHIDAEEPIPSGSPEEIEIRACALHSVELIKHELLASGRNVTSVGLDFLLWNRGRQPFYKASPRHRTRTVFY